MPPGNDCDGKSACHGSITVGLPTEQTAADPELEKVKLEVFPDSLTNEDGSPATEVGIFRVDSARLPAPLPDGLDHSFDITVQADAEFFDTPARITFRTATTLRPGKSRYSCPLTMRWASGSLSEP